MDTDANDERPITGEFPLDEGMDRETLTLFAQVIEANVASTQHLSNRLLAYEQDQSLKLARAFVALYSCLTEATKIVTTRPLDAALDATERYLDLAESTVSRLTEKLATS